MEDIDHIRTISESLDDINFDDISDDSNADEFGYNEKCYDWIIIWDDGVVRTRPDYRSEITNRSLEAKGYAYEDDVRFKYDILNIRCDDSDPDCDEEELFDDDRIADFICAILWDSGFWQGESESINDVYTSPNVGYWCDISQKLYVGRRKPNVEPGLQNNLIKVRWAYARSECD